jgi:hypothetical protein
MLCAIGWKGAAGADRTIRISNTVGWTLDHVFIDFAPEIDPDMGLRV